MRSTFLLVLVAPMTEPMNVMMWALLKEAGIAREECAIVYVLGGAQPAGAHEQVLKSQYNATRQAFRGEMEAAECRCVIPVGPEAFHSVTGLTWPIDEARGYVLSPSDCRPASESHQVQDGVYKSGPRKGEPKMKWVHAAAPPPLPRWFNPPMEQRPWGKTGTIVPTISFKQYVKQKRRQVTAVMAALETAAKFTRGEAEVEQFRYEDHITWSDLAAKPAPMSFDLEVPMGSRAIERLSLSFGSSCTRTWPWGEKEKRHLQWWLNAATVRIAHNIQFDEPILRANGITIPEPWWCSMIAASLIEPDLPKGLGPTIPLYLTARPWKYISTERGYTDPEYSATDAFMELRLYEEQKEALEGWGMTKLFTERIMPSVKALIDLKEKGLRDHPRDTETWCAGLQSEITDLLHWWDGHFPGVSATSNKDLATLFYRTWGLPPQRSKHDGWSVDKRAIRSLISIEPKYAEPLQKLLALRKVQKLLSTYGRALIGNEYVHPSYLPRGKDFDDEDENKGLPGTGRLASSGPNIQNQPPASRALYICDEPGWVWVAADMSQAELRIMAAKSEDEALTAALEYEGGVHARTMELIPGTTKTLAKNGIYGTSYGAGPKRLVDMLQENGVYTTTKAMKEFQNALARAYPRWWAYLQSIGAVGLAQGFLRNDFDRVRRFTAGGADVPAMKDFIPQSDVGDIGWTLYRPIWEAAQRVGGRMSMLVHDEVVVQCPRDKVAEMSDMLHDEMERPFDEVAPGFRIPIAVKVGERWGSAMVPYKEWR